MTGPIRDTTGERIQDVFVESPTRANKTAVEVYVGNAGDISGGGGTTVNVNSLSDYQETTGVINGVTTSILNHTFSATKASKIYSISASGENVSLYELFIDSVLIEKKRTYFGGDLNTEFNFNFGFSVGLSSVVELKAHHLRPNPSDYNVTLKYTEAI